jgi:acyl-CoA synthetase (AMP-forming)/AMP-acid ligase II
VSSALWELLSLPARVDPERLILSSHGRSYTLAELLARAGEFQGLLPPGRLAILDVNSDVAIGLIYGAFEAGKPVGLVNFRLRRDELAAVLRSAEMDTLAAGSRYVDLGHQVVGDAGISAFIKLDSSDGQVEVANAPDEPPSTGDEPGIILFTSGTTSLPKPVFLAAPAVAAYVMAGTPLCPPETRDEATLLTMPLHHVAGLIGLLRSVFAGRRVVVHEQFDEKGWLDEVASGAVTHTFVVPTMLHRLLQTPELAATDLSGLRSVTYGGGPMPRTVIERALAAFPSTVEFVSTYGLTETGGTVTVLDAGDHEAARRGDPLGRRRLASVGRALPDVQIVILDPDQEPLPPDRVGEVYVLGSRIPPAPTPLGAMGHRWFRSGDLGKLDEDGYLYLQGRADDVIVRGGENIAPTEIEEALRSHEAVIDCAVVGIPDEEWGSRVAAAVVLHHPVSPNDLVDHCRRLVASYKIPTKFQFVESLPLGDTGKVLRRAVRDQIVGSAIGIRRGSDPEQGRQHD